MSTHLREHPAGPTLANIRIPLRAALFCLALVTVTLLAGIPAARAADGINVTISAVSDAAFPRLALTLSAEEAGLPVGAGPGVTVHVTEDGQPLAVDSVTAASDSQQPLALVFAIDTSGSMAGGTLTSVQQSVTTLIQSLAAQDSAAVVGFADKVTIAQPLTSDKAALTSAVAALKVGGNTALYDAVAQSSAIASQSGASRRAIILLTDGEDYGGVSAATRDSSLSAVATGGTLVYVIGVGAQVDQPYLQEVADRSGGKFFASPDAEGVAAVYASLEQLLRSQIVVTVQSNSRAGSGDHTLAVRLDRGNASATAERKYTTPAGAVVSKPLPTPIPAPAVAPRAAAASHSGNTAPWLAIAAAGIGLIVAGSLLILYARRRRRAHTNRWTPSFDELDATVVPATSAFADVQSLESHRPFVIEVAELNAQAPLGSHPITIGSDPGCELVLTGSPEIAPEHARVWIRDGTPMLHHLLPGYTTFLNGGPAGWASIGPADRITIGPYTLRCVSAPLATQPRTEAAHI